MGQIIGIALWALIPGFMAKKKGRNFWGYYFLSFLISPLISMIIVACLKNLNMSYNGNQNNEYEQPEPIPQEQADNNIYEGEGDLKTVEYQDTTQSNKNTVCFCRKCGNKLLDGAVFCNQCGLKIRFDDE